MALQLPSFILPPGSYRASPLSGVTPELEAEAALYRRAYENWKAANADDPYAQYTIDAAKPYLKQVGLTGFRKWDYPQTKQAQIDQYGNITGTENIVPSWMGEQIMKGKYVAPSVMAAGMGMPKSEIDRLVQEQFINSLPPESVSKAWYKHSTGNWSNIPPSPGAAPDFIGTLSALNSYNKSLAASGKTYVRPSATPVTITPPVTTAPPVSTSKLVQSVRSPSNVSSAAQNLANVTKPAVPQLIQPYGRTKGAGAFGEKDINW